MSNRPTTLLKNGTLYWVLSVYDSSGVLVDADSTPSVTVRKNGAASAESVTVTKRGSSTGLYDCSMNPSLEAEGDTFHLEEELDISSVTYNNTWSVVVTEPMITSPEVSTAVWDVPTSSYLGAGTFGLRFSALNTTTPDNTSITAIKSVTDQMVFTIANELDCNAVSGGGGGDATAANQTAISNAIAALNDFDPATDTVGTVTTVSTVTSAVTTANAQDVSDILNSIPSNWDTMDIDASTGAVASQLTNEAIYLYFVSGSREDQFKADVSGLSTFDHTSDEVTTDIASRNASKADVSGLATSAEVTAVGSAVTGNASAIAVVDAVVDAIKVTTDKLDTALVLDGSVYQYTVNALENAPSGGGGGGDATAANQTTIINAISNLNDFDPSSDAVANVTLVATTTTNTDMRGTNSANTVAPDNASIASILADTNELQQNQGDWATATGFNTVAPDNAGITANGVAIAANLTAINNLNDVTVQEFWDALTSGSYASGSFGERLLRSTSQQAEVAITGSNHVAADIHELQDDVITAATIDASAVTEIQTGLATASELSSVPKTGTAYTHTNQSGDTMTVTIT